MRLKPRLTMCKARYGVFDRRKFPVTIFIAYCWRSIRSMKPPPRWSGGLTQVTNWVKLKFAAMNLKKLARWLWKENSPSFLSRLFLLLYAGNPAYSYR